MIHYIFSHWWAQTIFWLVMGNILAACICFRLDRFVVRTFRQVLNLLVPSTTPDWKIIMKTRRPGGGGGRNFSLHGLAALTGRNDLLKLAKELKRSCEVNAQYCGGVSAPVFYMHYKSDFNERKAWKMVKDFIKKYPYPTVKGFRVPGGHWSGGEYGRGTYIQDGNVMSDPFIKEDYQYANAIIKALREAGFEPGMPEYKMNVPQY